MFIGAFEVYIWIILKQYFTNVRYTIFLCSQKIQRIYNVLKRVTGILSEKEIVLNIINRCGGNKFFKKIIIIHAASILRKVIINDPLPYKLKV